VAAKHAQRFRGRVWFTRLMLSVAMVLLAARALQLQVIDSEYLQQQGNARFLRTVSEATSRGMVLDRNGQPLAISTPVDSLWADPEVLLDNKDAVQRLARALDTDSYKLLQQVRSHRGREFMYLKRQVSPQYAESVIALNIPGVSIQREYRRYYPAAEAAGHVIGFSNVDDRGQEGVELMFDGTLSGHPGKNRVLKDRFGRVVEKVESLGLGVSGSDVQLSIDRRLQYLAFRELKHAVEFHQARAGTAVILNVRSGEVLALVNEPSFNPNNRQALSSERYRNRAVTDLFEPGSTIKPFVIAAALEAGIVRPSTVIDTSPGTYTIGSKTIRDARNYGRLTVAGVIKKSSNVGASRIALKMQKQKLWQMLDAFGFGTSTGIGIPGETEGQLTQPAQWTTIDHASLSYGYGLSTTSIQLARAYATLANNGVMMPMSLIRLQSLPRGTRVVSESTAIELRKMMEGAVHEDGTGNAADVPYYRIAGKTGTIHKYINGAYSEDRYTSLFAGFAPASDPQLVMVVTIDDPRRHGYYGGQVAAPVFSNVMAGALRLMNIMPDDSADKHNHLVQNGIRRAG